MALLPYRILTTIYLFLTLLVLLFSPSSVVLDSLQPHGLEHARVPCPSLSPGVCSNSCPLSQWCHPTISSSVTPFSCPQSFPASVSFPVSLLFTSGGQMIGASTSASLLQMNIQDWVSLGLTALISLWSKGLSRVFSSSTVWKHQFFFFNLFFLFPFIFISWRLITLQYCSGFWHTLTWISHGFTCVPHPDPPSYLPPHPIPLGLPSAPVLSTCLMHPTWASDLFHHW